MLENKQQYLLLRYSTAKEKDCIQKHIDVIDKHTYCWFGKTGNVPSDRILHAVYSESNPCIVLHKSGTSFICNTSEYSIITPLQGVPLYYEEQSIKPSIYFKLLSIEKCDEKLLHDSIVCSTGTFVDDAINHSRIPFMLCRYEDEKQHIPLSNDDCRYRKDGYCTFHSCVNYSCYCYTPSSCKSQRK